MKTFFYLIALSIMIYPNKVLSQADASLILPKKIDGSVKLKLSAIPNYKTETSPSNFLSVYVKNDGEDYSSYAVQGRYRVENDYLRFTPYFPFEGGMSYVVRVQNPEADNKYTYHLFQPGRKQVLDTAKVMGIYPLAAELPENLLRLYIYFNTPMKKGQALTHIQLVDAAGNIDNQAFMEFKQELWSADGKRLTLLFDPGRIKRGVSTNLDLGPALLEGNQYQLTIAANWQDVHGQDLAFDFKKEFGVVKAYREQILAKDLEILVPKENSSDSLRISFNRIMDHALIQSMIRIEFEDRKLVGGHWEISKDETKALFFPEGAWKKGSYRLIMNGRLEDVSGNNLNNLLDQKIKAEHELNPEEIIRSFSI